MQKDPEPCASGFFCVYMDRQTIQYRYVLYFDTNLDLKFDDFC